MTNCFIFFASITHSRDLTTEVERLSSALLDTETKLKQEAANVKSKLNTEVQSLQFSADEQERNLEVLRNLVQKQQRQIQVKNICFIWFLIV